MTFADRCATQGVRRATETMLQAGLERGAYVTLADALRILQWSRIGPVRPVDVCRARRNEREATWVWR